MTEKSNCRACGAPMIWAKTVNGSLQPFDAEPSEKGNVVIKDGIAHVIKEDLFSEEAPEGQRFMPHHATCPEAKKFRKKK